MIRRFFAVLTGVVVFMITTLAFEFVIGRLYPPSRPADVNDTAALAEIVRAMPTPAFVLLLVGWFDATFTGAAVATALTPDRRRGPAMAVAAIGLAGAAANMHAIPHPEWVQINGLALFFPAALLGWWVVHRFARRPEAPPPTP